MLLQCPLLKIAYKNLENVTNYHITLLIPDCLANNNNANLIAIIVDLHVEDPLMKTVACSQI